ncbi:hypothetical protein B0H14DRAFT_3426444 [Mycena olivaceomarginata]|nr:hypothetical protein B0H14DRAFT_3426444 [Mycena olivaceomarginata]
MVWEMFVALAIMQPRKCPTARGPAANKRPLVAMRAEVTVQIDAPCKRALAPGDWAIILRSLAAPAWDACIVRLLPTFCLKTIAGSLGLPSGTSGRYVNCVSGVTFRLGGAQPRRGVTPQVAPGFAVVAVHRVMGELWPPILMRAHHKRELCGGEQLTMPGNAVDRSVRICTAMPFQAEVREQRPWPSSTWLETPALDGYSVITPFRIPVVAVALIWDFLPGKLLPKVPAAGPTDNAQ